MSIRDLGISAFKSQNIDECSLGGFIQAVRDGKIPKGIVLCVEALDRLTRESPANAVTLLVSIVNLGIDIGVVADNKILSKELFANSAFELVIALTLLIRGYDESRMKSGRTGDAIKRMIEKVKEGKPCQLGGYLPHWLTYDKDMVRFIPHLEKTNTVKTIFAKYLEGKGTTTIVKEIQGMPKWNNNKSPIRANGIRSLLRNKQVTGTLTLGGVSFPKYLPVIIEEKDFDAVAVMVSKNTKRRGNHSGNVNNLFNRHIFCKHCGSPLGAHNGPTKLYFKCLNARDLACEIKKSRPVNDVELWIFAVLLNQSPSILIAEKNTEMEKEVFRLENELHILNIKKDRTFDLLEDVETSMDELKPKLAAIKSSIQTTTTALIEARVKASEQKKAPANISEFLQLLGKDLKNLETRRKIKAILPGIVERIDVDLEEFMIGIKLHTGTLLGGKYYATDEEAEDGGF